MNPLIVTAFFDIGRGEWTHLTRSQDAYVRSFQRYTALLPAKKYALIDPNFAPLIRGDVDYLDAADFAELPAQQFMDRTRDIMQSASFQQMFDPSDRNHHIEQHIPEYNVLMMAKWDALERAAALTHYDYSHYVWADFGLGRRGQKRPYLPAPTDFAPIERDRIVLSAGWDWHLHDDSIDTLKDRVCNFREQAAGSLMIIPRELMDEFMALARERYQALLDLNLTTDDQLVIDMCVFKRPEMFYLSYPPRGLSKFNHFHNIVHGLDATQPRMRSIPVWDGVTRKLARHFARRRIGLKR